jgi:3-deoxy-D-manno-octulosonate 8-phosphate phosphatase (KDO 8-P phosphatase)
MIPGNRSWTPELERKARRLELLLLDVDGVLTEGQLHVGERGELFKSFSIRDGLAVKLAQDAGLEVAILSSRDSAIVTRRAAEVGIAEVLQGHEDKGAALHALLERRGLAATAVAYVGDDLQDLPVLLRVGLSAAPADAVAEVRERVDYVTSTAGGRGCVRELVERLLAARGAWDATLLRFLAAADDDRA